MAIARSPPGCVPARGQSRRTDGARRPLPRLACGLDRRATCIRDPHTAPHTYGAPYIQRPTLRAPPRALRRPPARRWWPCLPRLAPPSNLPLACSAGLPPFRATMGTHFCAGQLPTACSACGGPAESAPARELLTGSRGYEPVAGDTTGIRRPGDERRGPGLARCAWHAMGGTMSAMPTHESHPTPGGSPFAPRLRPRRRRRGHRAVQRAAAARSSGPARRLL